MIKLDIQKKKKKSNLVFSVNKKTCRNFKETSFKP